MINFKNYDVRKYTKILINMIDEGAIDPVTLSIDLLNYISEDDVKDFARIYDLIQEDDEE